MARAIEMDGAPSLDRISHALRRLSDSGELRPFDPGEQLKHLL
jgi:hypothetical protein